MRPPFRNPPTTPLQLRSAMRFVLSFAAVTVTSSLRHPPPRSLRPPALPFSPPLQRSPDLVLLQLLRHTSQRLCLLRICHLLSTTALRLGREVSPAGRRVAAAFVSKRVLGAVSRSLCAAWSAALSKGEQDTARRWQMEAKQKRRPGCALS